MNEEQMALFNFQHDTQNKTLSQTDETSFYQGSQQLLSNYPQSSSKTSFPALKTAYKILFIGSCGAGKSSTINSLAAKHFAETNAKMTAKSVTEEVKTYMLSNESTEYLLIDTPGLSENTMADVQRHEQIKGRLDMVVFVFPTGRWATEENVALQIFAKDWKDYHRKSVMVLVQKNEAIDLDSLLNEPFFGTVWNAVEGRHVEVDNKHSSPESMDDARRRLFNYLTDLSQCNDSSQHKKPKSSINCVIT